MPVVPTIASLIDARFPKRLYVVAQIRGNSETSDRMLETMIGPAQWPVLLHLQGSDFGRLDPNEYNPLNTSVLLGAPPAMFPQFREGLRLSNVADAVIYRGANGNPLIQANPAYTKDEVYAMELQRRMRIAAPPRPKPQ